MAGHVPTLTFDADCTFLEVSPDQRYILEHQAIKRSQLLTEICGSATAVGQVRVPVSASALHNWLRHVQPGEVGKRPIIDQEDVDGGIIESPTAADAVPNVPASMAPAATDAASRSEQRTPDAARLRSSLADTTAANSSLVGCEKRLSDQIGYVEQHCSILQVRRRFPHRHVNVNVNNCAHMSGSVAYMQVMTENFQRFLAAVMYNSIRVLRLLPAVILCGQCFRWVVLCDTVLWAGHWVGRCFGSWVLLGICLLCVTLCFGQGTWRHATMCANSISVSGRPSRACPRIST